MDCLEPLSKLVLAKELVFKELALEGVLVLGVAGSLAGRLVGCLGALRQPEVWGPQEVGGFLDRPLHPPSRVAGCLEEVD